MTCAQVAESQLRRVLEELSPPPAERLRVAQEGEQLIAVRPRILKRQVLDLLWLHAHGPTHRMRGVVRRQRIIEDRV